MTKSNPDVLTLREFAEFMGVHYMSARNYANAGLLSEYGAYQLPHGYWRIPRSGAEQFKQHLQQQAPHPNGSQSAPAQPAKKRVAKKTVRRPARKR